MNGLLAASSLVALVAATAAATPARAEWLAIQRVRHTPPAGGPARETEVRTWIGPDRLREEAAGGAGYLLRLDLGRAWVIDRAAGTCREVVPPRPTAGDPGRGSGGIGNAVVTDTGDTRTIGGRSSRRWHLSRRSPRGNAAPPALVETDLWTTEAIPASAFLAERSALAAGAQPVTEQLRKVLGFPVLEVERTTFLGVTEERVTELVSIEERAAPPGTWELPAGCAGDRP